MTGTGLEIGAQAMAAGLKGREDGPVFRDATDADLVGLRDLERDANQAALSHVFPPSRYPFPDDAVLARWRLVMDDPQVAVLVLDDPGERGLLAYVAYDDTTLRHLAVRPDRWREGLATVAVEMALEGIRLSGTTEASLWCLQDNQRARRLYEHLGWRPTDDVREAPWPPHPVETRYIRSVSS